MVTITEKAVLENLNLENPESALRVALEKKITTEVMRKSKFIKRYGNVCEYITDYYFSALFDIIPNFSKLSIDCQMAVDRKIRDFLIDNYWYYL